MYESLPPTSTQIRFAFWARGTPGARLSVLYKADVTPKTQASAMTAHHNVTLSHEWEKHSFGGIESRSMSTDEQRSQFAIYLTTVSTAWLDDLEVTVV